MGVCLPRVDVGRARLLVLSGCLESVFCFWDREDGAWP
jgi:hypothetical protein